MKVAQIGEWFGLQIVFNIEMAREEKAMLQYAAPMHDVGKIGVPDQILLKPGKLDDKEFQIIKLHTVIGGKILRQRGFSEKLARICETHILGGLDKDDARKFGLPIRNYLPETLEEKIICLADKHMAGTREVSIQERFNRWFQKYGRSKILIKSKKRIEKIQKEIKGLM